MLFSVLLALSKKNFKNFQKTTEKCLTNLKNFTFFIEIFEKYPDDLEKYVVNKVRRLKKIKEIFQKVAKIGQRF